MYVNGQKINFNGLKAKIVFEDDTTAILPNEILTLPDITFSQIGTQTITIGYNENLTATFNVQVIDEADGVARIGVNYYSSLENALLNISSGDTIELLKNIEVTEGYTITQNITINGNNHTLTRANAYLSV